MHPFQSLKIECDPIVVGAFGTVSKKALFLHEKLQITNFIGNTQLAAILGNSTFIYLFLFI